MRLTNGQIKAALDAMTALTTGGNRLPTLAALRADRIRRALDAAWAPCEAQRVRLIEEHGQPVEGGGFTVMGTTGWPDFVREFNAMAAEERVLELEAITTRDLEAGYFRDPETGRKEPALDVAPAALGLLVDLGLIVEPSTNGSAAHE